MGVMDNQFQKILDEYNQLTDQMSSGVFSSFSAKGGSASGGKENEFVFDVKKGPKGRVKSTVASDLQAV